MNAPSSFEQGMSLWLNEKDYVYAFASNQKREKICWAADRIYGFPCHLFVCTRKLPFEGFLFACG